MKEENKDVEIEDYLEIDDDTEDIQPEIQDFDDDDEDEHERDSGEDMQPLHKIDSEKIPEPESNHEPVSEPSSPEGVIKNETPPASSFRLMRFQEFSDSSD